MCTVLDVSILITPRKNAHRNNPPPPLTVENCAFSEYDHVWLAMAMPLRLVDDIKLSQPKKLSRRKYHVNIRVYLFRPLLRGGGTIYSNGFFFVQSILADRSSIIRKLVQRRIWN